MKTSLCLIAIILIYLFVIKGVNTKTLLAKVNKLLTKVIVIFSASNFSLKIIIFATLKENYKLWLYNVVL